MREPTLGTPCGMRNHAGPKSLTSVSSRHTGSAQGVEAHLGIMNYVLCLLLKSGARGASRVNTSLRVARKKSFTLRY
jgi:hypothetical protein